MTQNKAKPMVVVALGSLFLVGGGVALAGSSENPAAPREVKDMDCLLGNWKGTGKMTMGTTSADVKLTWSCKRASGDWGVACQLRMTGMPGMAIYEENDLFGFDAGAGKYHWFAVTNSGETHDHVADVPKGEDIRWLYTGTQEGKPFKEVVDMHFGDGGKAMTVKAETFLDGNSTSVFAATARR